MHSRNLCHPAPFMFYHFLYLLIGSKSIGPKTIIFPPTIYEKYTIITTFCFFEILVMDGTKTFNVFKELNKFNLEHNFLFSTGTVV